MKNVHISGCQPLNINFFKNQSRTKCLIAWFITKRQREKIGENNLNYNVLSTKITTTLVEFFCQRACVFVSWEDLANDNAE